MLTLCVSIAKMGIAFNRLCPENTFQRKRQIAQSEKCHPSTKYSLEASVFRMKTLIICIINPIFAGIRIT